MKIIKRGHVPMPKETVYRAMCRICGSVIEFNKNDLKAAGRQYNELIYTFDCPVCESTEYIYEYDLPKCEWKVDE